MAREWNLEGASEKREGEREEQRKEGYWLPCVRGGRNQDSTKRPWCGLVL
jgi:hypothetical protein